MQCLFSPLAELDLEDVGDYIARDVKSEARSFCSQIPAPCSLLRKATSPYIVAISPKILRTFGHKAPRNAAR